MSSKSNQKRSEKRKTALVIIGTVILFIVVLGCLLKFLVIDKLEDKAATQVVEKMLDSEAASDTELANGMTGEELYNSMSSKDQETLKSVITDNISPKTISQASEYVTNGDMDGLKEYAKDNLSDEELDTVKELYLKYAQ